MRLHKGLHKLFGTESAAPFGLHKTLLALILIAIEMSFRLGFYRLNPRSRCFASQD
jgi:hypothetical protein